MLILSTTAFSFAEENTVYKQTYMRDIEFEITKDNIDKDGHFEIEIPQEAVALSEGMIEGSALGTMTTEAKKLPSIVVDGYAKKNAWKGTTLELGIGCKASGKIKTYNGTCNIYKSNGISKIQSKSFSMTNSSGTKALVRQYTFKMGNYKSCRVKLTNQVAIDIYGRSGSMYSYQSGLIKK